MKVTFRFQNSTAKLKSKKIAKHYKAKYQYKIFKT